MREVRSLRSYLQDHAPLDVQVRSMVDQMIHDLTWNPQIKVTLEPDYQLDMNVIRLDAEVRGFTLRLRDIIDIVHGAPDAPAPVLEYMLRERATSGR